MSLSASNALTQQTLSNPKFAEASLPQLSGWQWRPTETVRKPARSECVVISITEGDRLQTQAESNLKDQIRELRHNYGFPEEGVENFLAAHRAVRALLIEAVPQLRSAFGQDRIINLEMSKDDDDAQTLHAIVIWNGDAKAAASALREFCDDWWLQRMDAGTSDLAFVYKLV